MAKATTSDKKAPASTDYRIPTARRRHKGKYLQGLMIDLAREMAKVIPESTSSYATFVHRDGYQGLRAATMEVLPDATARNLMAVLGSAIATRLSVMTGIQRYELSTWNTPTNMQELTLRLYSQDGWSLTLAAFNHSAHKHMQALAALSDCMDAAFGATERKAGDMERFLKMVADVSQPEIILPNTWRAVHPDIEGTRGGMSAGVIATYSEDAFLGRSTTTLPSHPGEIEAARLFLRDADLPKSIHQIEAYEAACAIEDGIRMENKLTSEIRSEVAAEKRYETLNPTLRAGIEKRTRNIKETSIEDLKKLADERALTHLAVEFGISDVALAKRLKKAGWVNPRKRSSPRFVFGRDMQA